MLLHFVSVMQYGCTVHDTCARSHVQLSIPGLELSTRCGVELSIRHRVELSASIRVELSTRCGVECKLCDTEEEEWGGLWVG